MAVRVGVQARKVEHRLRVRLPHVSQLEAYHDYNRWNLSWSDGPTPDTMRAVLGEPDLTRLAPDLAPEAWAMHRIEQPLSICVRMISLALAGELPEYPDRYSVLWMAQSAARRTDDPDQSNDPLCTALAARLYEAATGDETVMGDLVTKNGIAWLHPDHQDRPLSEGVPQQQDSSLGYADPHDPLRAVQVLTARYATRQEAAAWRRSLVTLPVGDAVTRALADPDAERASLLAVHTLIPVLRADLDRTEGMVLTRARDAGATWQEIGAARGTSEQAAQQLARRRTRP